MMKIEQIDQLRERAHVSYEEAKEALEKCNEDIVEALIYLEKNQKIKAQTGCTAKSGSDFGNAVKNIIHKGNSTKLVISKGEKEVMRTPVTLAAVITVVAPYLAVGGAAVGLFTGYKAKFVKKDGSEPEVNKVVNKVSDAVDAAKKKFTEKTTSDQE